MRWTPLLYGLLLAMLLASDMTGRDHPEKSGTGIRQPNIIFIYADDWGYGDLGCHGHPIITTPNLDQLAASGTEFMQFNVCNPVCSPSRTAIMTGHYPARYHIHQHFASHDLNMGRNMPDWLDPDTLMLSRLFQDAGYKTAHYGKWHLTNNGVFDPPLPVIYGYDDSRVFNGPGPQVGVPIGISTGKCVDYTIDFLERNRDHPVFINIWIHESHAVIDPPEDAKTAYAHVEEPYRSYYACISYADRELGRLFSYLDEEKLDSSTLVIFSSDNGPESPNNDPDHKLWYSRGETAGLRGQKRSLHEGGVGLPFIVYWPGVVPAGIKNTTTHLAGVDMLPSLCAIAGIGLPESYVSDGEDLSEAFFGEAIQRTKPVFWEWRGTASGENWPRLAVRSGDWKLLTNYDGSLKTLYNIQADRREFSDSAGYYPELSDSLFLMVSDWKSGLPENIPVESVSFYTNDHGDRVVADFSAHDQLLEEVFDPDFRLYRAGSEENIPISGFTHDSQRLFLNIDSTVVLSESDDLSIVFRSGRIMDAAGKVLLVFSTEPVMNNIKSEPDPLVLGFTVFDASSRFRLHNATIKVEEELLETNLNGQVFFHLPPGNYSYQAEKTDYHTAEAAIQLSSDMMVDIFLDPLLADVKFQVLPDSSPVNLARIELADKIKYQ